MLVSGEIENVPLLEVLQVVSFSRQTGVLSVESSSGQGALLFEGGGIVCADSVSTRALLLRAAAEFDPRTRLALRRVQALAALTELLALRSGSFRFRTLREPLAEIGGVSTKSFYESGPMDAGELLVVLATTIDKKDAPVTEPVARAQVPVHDRERTHPRFSPTLIPATLELPGSRLEGHLTNLSEGGAFFHGEALPPSASSCQIYFVLPGQTDLLEARARVAWVRPDGKGVKKGAGLSFEEVRDDVRDRVRRYLERFQRLADEVSAPVGQVGG
jgi:hypothetical protein